jgi:hypothetical protein
VLCLAPAPVPAQQPRAELPTYAVGEKWVRSDGIYDLLRIEGDRYIFVAAAGREIHLTKDLALAKLVRGRVVEWEFDPPARLAWPLQVGKWGSQLANVRSPRATAGINGQLAWSVDSYEDVSTPAGTFKAFWIRISFQPDLQGHPMSYAFMGGILEFRVAYAPEARQIVMIQAQNLGSLLPFQVVAIERGQPPASAPPPGVPPPPAPASILAAPGPPAGAAPPGRPPAAPGFQVTIGSPQDQASGDQERIALAGLASGGPGIARVIVTLNGVEVGRQEPPTPQPTLPLNLPLMLREGANTLVVTAVAADGTTAREVRTVHYVPRTPLTVAVRYPPDGARVGDAVSVVVAAIGSSRGVAEVQVTLNGAEVHREAERALQRSLVVSVPVTLRDGSNAIAITAKEPDGTVRQELRTVFLDRQLAAAPAPGPPPPRPVPQRWAVVVGIGNYESPGVPRLTYTVPDAEAVYQMLTGPAGFKKDHVLLLTDKTERKPTLRNLRWALGTFLARSAGKDDMVLIYFAGHGAPEVDPRGHERDGLAKYLIPADADPDDLYASALPMDELHTIFGRIEADQVVVFVDACYSGAAGGRTFAKKGFRDIRVVDEAFLDRLTRTKGRAIITASRPTELSMELPELGHGIFTYYLVRGMQGAADLDRDGVVTLQELYQYLEQEVTRKSRAAGGNQHPVMKGELEGVLPLLKVMSK